MITLLNVTKTYANGHVGLSDLSLQIMAGEMVFLQGHSGAGKSTLLKLLGLLERPSRGQIIVGGKHLQHITNDQIPYYRRQIGYITQNPKLLQHYTVLENVAMPLVVIGCEKSEREKRVRAALNRVGLLSKENFYPSQLSEGEQQRIGVARAIVHKPKIVLADEPTGNLDPELSLEIFKLLAQFNQVGVTILIASHDADLIAQLPFRTIRIAQGKLLPGANTAQPSATWEEAKHA